MLPRHASAAPDPGLARFTRIRRTPPSRRHGWHLLLIVPVVMPLLTPLYNRVEPTLGGMPFFYWYQLACVVVACVVITAVYQLTKGRRDQ